MSRDLHIKHIAYIFQALDVGLDGLTEGPDNEFETVLFSPPLEKEIDPSVFNRETVTIDGEEYTVSIFRPMKFEVPDGFTLHDGGDIPDGVHLNYTVEINTRGGSRTQMRAGAVNWKWGMYIAEIPGTMPREAEVTSYRVIEP